MRTLLHWSVDKGDLEMCKLLMLHGADSSLMDLDNETPVDYAVTCDHEHILLLFKHQQNSN